jgi:tRNA U34 5-carboxymethylaminomethyl modifying GTPase MnmE/TrmE
MHFILESAHLFFYSVINDKHEDREKVSEIYKLLDPHHFQALDPAFMNAAGILRAKLGQKEIKRSTSSELKISYDKLEQFRKVKGRLTQIASELFDLIKQSADRKLVSEILKDEAVQVLDKAQSQYFRLAVIGEFSQGKSTLLNALLGSEIQPVRAIPCSGTVTVLRHGEKYRVICRYKNGQEEEVPIEKYKELASISKEAALLNIPEELSKSAIQEIVFEHPNLELCRHQVEIIDSPGLNEHPERTAITHQLLKNTDAVIFMANASRSFTQSEMELLEFLRKQLNGGDSQDPSESLFVAVNFIDLLRRDEDRANVKQRANNFLLGPKPIITGKDRLHFISAQAALDAILEGNDDEYLKGFQQFTQAIQVFLAEERGSLIIEKLKNSLSRLTEETRIGLRQSIQILEGEISLSESERSQIIEQIGAASGREVKLRLLRDDLVNEVLDDVNEAWKEWLDGVEDRIAEKSAEWTSEAESKEKILRDFANQFLNDLSEDLDNWLDKTVKDKLLLPKLKEFDKKIFENLNSIYENLKSIDLVSSSSLSQQFRLSLSHFGVNIQFESNLNPSSINGDGIFGVFKTLGSGGLLGGGVAGGLAFLGVGFLPILLAGMATSAVVGWFFGSDSEKIVLQMKQEVYNKGFEKFSDSLEEIGDNIGEGVVKAINSQYENAIKAIQHSISLLDEILSRQSAIHQETIDSKRAKKAFASDKLSSLSSIESSLDSLPSSSS